MYYLGQTILYRNMKMDPIKVGILIGYNQFYAPIIHKLDLQNNLVKEFQTFDMDIFPIRIKDDASPTGFSIFKGEFYKKGFIAPVKLKLPGKYRDDDAELKNWLLQLQHFYEQNKP